MDYRTDAVAVNSIIYTCVHSI